MIAKYKRGSRVGAAVCFAAFVAYIALASLTDADSSQAMRGLSQLSMGVSGVALILTLWFVVQAKGRSNWWMLALVLNIIGLVVILMLKDHADGEEPTELRAGPNAKTSDSSEALMNTQAPNVIEKTQFKLVAARVIDLLCFVIGPVLIVVSSFSFSAPRTRYDSNKEGALMLIGVGIALVAFGLLRKYWAMKDKRK